MVEPGREVFMYRVDTADGERDAVSILDHDWVFEHGLCLEAILGYVRDGTAEDPFEPTDFRENPAFLWFLSRVIFESIDAVDDLHREADLQGTGYVYLLDQRTPDPSGRVPPEDIIGAVQVDASALVPGSFQHNPRHRLLTANGFFRLPDQLDTALVRRLRERSAA